MYKEAEEHIKKGLSLVPRILLGSISGLFAVVLLFIGVHGVTHSVENWFAYFAFGMFCSLIALASFTRGRVRQFIGSCIGISIFGLACWYLIAELSGGILIGGKRSEPSIFNAILFMGAFGVPGITYTLMTRFGIGNYKEE